MTIDGFVVAGGRKDAGVSSSGTAGGLAVHVTGGGRSPRHRIETGDAWFEDFGAAKLARGRVVVKLDAEFAGAIGRGAYHVFLTATGDCRGLYVSRQTGARFEVRELQGGTSSVAFAYRVIGRRDDGKAAVRPMRGRARPPRRRKRSKRSA